MKKRFQYFFLFLICTLGILLCGVEEYPPGYKYSDEVALGTGQDGGVPQAGTDHPGWKNPERVEKGFNLAEEMQHIEF